MYKLSLKLWKNLGFYLTTLINLTWRKWNIFRNSFQAQESILGSKSLLFFEENKYWINKLKAYLYVYKYL